MSEKVELRNVSARRVAYGKFKMITDSHTYPAGLPYALVKDHLNVGDDYIRRIVVPSLEDWWAHHRYATKDEFASEVRMHHDGYFESGDFLQVPHLYDEDKAFVFSWRFLGDTVVLELYDTIFG